MTNFYKGHKKERTASLHKAFDEMSKDAALEYAVKELGFSKSGASSWFSWWAAGDQKTANTKTPKQVHEDAVAEIEKKAKAPAKKKAVKDKPAPKAKAPKKPKTAQTPKMEKELEVA